MSGTNRQPPSGQDYLPNGQRQGQGDWGQGQGDQRPSNQQNSQPDNRTASQPDNRTAAQRATDERLAERYGQPIDLPTRGPVT